MIKHLGKHNNKKVAILYREVPNEDHMALVVYTESLPRKIADVVIQVLESSTGQNADSLADVLHRNVLADGSNALGTLHNNGFIKKVPTNQVIVTATPSSSVRLDELNKLINQMKGSEEATRKLAELDANSGFKGNNPYAKEEAARAVEEIHGNNEPQALDDSYFATQNLAQAQRMKSEAAGLLAEAARLEEEAKKFLPAVEEKKVVKTRAPRAKKTVTAQS